MEPGALVARSRIHYQLTAAVLCTLVILNSGAVAVRGGPTLQDTEICSGVAVKSPRQAR